MAVYEILDAVIDEETRLRALDETGAQLARGDGDEPWPNVRRLVRTSVGEHVLASAQPRIEAAALTPLAASYSCVHVYAQGAVHPLHLDDDRCSVTVSLTLDYDAEKLWPLILMVDERFVSIGLERGTGVLFDATRYLHARRRLRGRFWTQLSLHYTRASEFSRS